MLTHHERCSFLKTASPLVGVCFQNPSLESLLFLRAHSWQQGTQDRGDKDEVKKEGRGTVKLPTEGHTPHKKTMQQQHDTPLSTPHPNYLSLSSDARQWAALHQTYCCVCVSNLALPCVVSHHHYTERSSVLCSVLAAVLINPRVMDQVSATQPFALLLQSGPNKQL